MKLSSQSQGDIFRAEGREEEERTARDKWQAKIESERRHKAAFVESIRGPVLLKNLLSGSRNQTAESELHARIFSGKNQGNGALSLREQFEIDIAELGDRVHQVLISPTFYVQLFHTKVFCIAFMCLQFRLLIYW